MHYLDIITRIYMYIIWLAKVDDKIIGNENGLPLKLDTPRYWFRFNWSAAYALCVLKLRYNQNFPLLGQSHFADFQEPCVFKCYVHCFKRRQRKRE